MGHTNITVNRDMIAAGRYGISTHGKVQLLQHHNCVTLKNVMAVFNKTLMDASKRITIHLDI